ncbi:MAG: hypothetical protein ACYSWQ_19240 [Planctomycetota bacterium]|jgi:hypothetical protein
MAQGNSCMDGYVKRSKNEIGKLTGGRVWLPTGEQARKQHQFATAVAGSLFLALEAVEVRYPRSIPWMAEQDVCQRLYCRAMAFSLAVILQGDGFLIGRYNPEARRWIR